MADYGNYDSGTGDVISAIQRPAIDLNQVQQAAPIQQQPVQQPFPVDDLINNAIAARQNIESRRQLLAANLQGNHPHAWKEGITQQIEGLDQAAHGVMQDVALRMQEATQARIGAHEQAQLAADALKTDREHSIDEHGAALMTGLGRLDAAHRNGELSDEDYNNHLLDLGQQHGLGLRHPDAGKMYEHFVGEADRRDQFNLRRVTSEAAKLAGRYGIQPQVDEDGRPSIEHTRQAALQTPKGRQEFLKGLGDEMDQKYGIPLGVASLFNPVAPHMEGKPTESGGKTIKIPFINKGKRGDLDVPVETFNQMKSDFQDRYFSVFPKAPSTQPSQQQGGLQAGATRNVGGKDYSWNGNKWEAQ